MTDLATPAVVRVPAGSAAPGTLVDLLRSNAVRRPDAVAFTHLRYPPGSGDRGERLTITRGQLDARCRALATAVAAHAGRRGRVLVLLPPGIDLLVGVLGTLYAGATAVACPPPVSGPGDPRTERARQIAGNAEVSLVVTLAGLADQLDGMGGALGGDVPRIRVDRLDEAAAAGYEPPEIAPGDLALLQYTSGSTGAPKGVMVSHANLMHQLDQMRHIARLPDGANIVTWISPYHALGIAGHLVLAQYLGGTGVFLTPEDFIPHPIRWLRAISDTPGPVLSCAPNFAFDRCVDHVTADQRAALDLSGWHTTLNAAERVRAHTIDRFVTAYAPRGFRRTAMAPGFGMTETMLFVTGRHADPDPTLLDVDAASLEQGRVVLDPASDAEPGERRLRLVGVGLPGPHCEVIVVDPATRRRLAGDRVGEVWIRGPIVCQGYWRRDELTDETFRATLADGDGPYLRTGDLGFLHDGELVLCGRLKELIIIRGRNLYPQDIELTSERVHPALAGAPAAAFAVEGDAGERLVVVQSVPDPAALDVDVDSLAARIRAAVTIDHEVEVHEVLVVPPSEVSKTVSGKVQRGQCRTRYLAGELTALATSIAETPAGPSAPATPVRGMLTALEPALRPAVIAAELRSRLGELLGLPPERVRSDLPIAGLGLESLRAMELRGALERDIGVPVPLALFLRGSVAELADHLANGLSRSSEAAA